MARRTKKEELLSQIQLDNIRMANVSQLKDMITDATKILLLQSKLLKEDTEIQSKKEDVKILTDAYNDIIKGCKYKIELCIDRLSALEEL